MNTVLFDLDGTLLPIDQRAFLDVYFSELTARFEPVGFAPNRLIATLWKGTEAMLTNDGAMTNGQRFWQVFAQEYGERSLQYIPQFNAFYGEQFNRVARVCTPHRLAGECLKVLRQKGYAIVLATNPVFPEQAAHSRLHWIGLKYDDFDHVTHYSNSSYCKPDRRYYQQAIAQIGRRADQCLMVGNDVAEDMCAGEMGMDTFLLHPHIINSKNEDASAYRQGDFEALYDHLQSLPAARFD